MDREAEVNRTTKKKESNIQHRLRAVSLFLRFSQGSARDRERRSRETRKTRAADRGEKRETAHMARANKILLVNFGQ